MSIRVLVLSSLALVAFQQFQTVEVPRPHARCTWAQESPERLALRLRQGMVLDGGNGDYSDWDSWVEAHALGHGWRNHFDGPDVIAVDHSVLCPESVLQAIASIDDLSSGPREESLHLEFALVLERNGRVDEALALLKKNAAMIHTSRPQDTFVYAARAAQESAKLCARHGHWNEAREFAQVWVPHSRCGNCIPGEERRIAEFRARCSLELKRWDEAREFVCAQVPQGRGVDESLLESWIAASLGSGAALNASAALEQLERCKPYVAKSYPFVLRHIEWLRLPPEERAAHFGELCADSDEHVAESLEYLLAHPKLLDQRLDTITQTFLARSDWGWLRVLAPLGDPRVLAAIDRELPHAAGDDEQFLQELRKVWQAAADRIR